MLSCCFHRRRRQQTNPALDADDGISSRLSLPAAEAAGGRFILAPSATGWEEGARGWRGGGAGMVVKVLSTNPFGDFRRSMLEVVEARRGAAAAAAGEEVFDWGFMEELLACCLNLNERSVHDDILRAYTDLTTSFRFIAW